MRLLLIFVLLSCLKTSVQAQEAPDSTRWEWDVSVWGYIVPDDSDYLQPTVAVDRDWLHLEGRYNYEERNTGSAWFGYNVSFGNKVAFTVTPMVGGIIGGLTGVGAGFELSVEWWKLYLATDGEYVWDIGDIDGSFLYNWSQLGLSPWPWLEVGLAGQRTRAYHSDREYQPGFFGTLTWKIWNAGVYVLNPDQSPVYIIAVGAIF